jgi:hypothetical protein
MVFANRSTKQTRALILPGGSTFATLSALSIEVRGDQKENKEPPCFRRGYKVYFHSSLLFLTIVLSSSGMGGGTCSPEICFTAPKRGGQASKQVPHFMHLPWSITWIWFLSPKIASAGHLLRQIPQAWHFSGSI